MTKINFKQPKYIFPVVIFVPVCALIYFVMQTFGGSGDGEQKVATDRINTELPQANAEEAGDKMYEMSRRFGDEDAFTAVGALGEEKTDSEELEHGYSEEELNRLDAAEAERIRQQQELEELERSLAESRMILTPIPTVTEQETDILRKTILHGNWRRFSSAVMNVRRQLKPDSVSVSLTRRKY